MRRRVVAGALAMVFMCAAHAHASSIVFSNLGPGDTFDLSEGWGVVSGSDFAEGFIPSASYTLDAIRLPALLVAGVGNELDIALAADDGGIPGAILESFVLPVTNVPTILTASSLLHPLLDTNTLYWITAGVPDVLFPDFTFVGWPDSIGGFGPYAVTLPNQDVWSGHDNGPQAAFEVTGTPVTPVPEPASLTLVGIGLASLVARRRR